MHESPQGCNKAASDQEVWRPVVGYEDAYEVSNRGRVRQTGKVRSNASSHRLMKQNLFKGRNYLYVGLCPNGLGSQNIAKCQKKIPVHVLVAEAFLGPRPSGLVVNHKDGCSLNNWAENLEYCTTAGNSHHAFKTGLAVFNLTPEKVRAIRALPPEVNNCEAGRRFGVHPSQVSRIRRRLAWVFLD